MNAKLKSKSKNILTKQIIYPLFSKIKCQNYLLKESINIKY